jgi:transcriptional regulator with XRE-family HTH domain
MLTKYEIKKIRKKMRLTQYEFAIATGYTERQISRFENGVTAVDYRSESVFLLTFSRWSGASKYGVSIDSERKIRVGLYKLLAA